MQGWAMAVIVGEASWRLLHVMAPVTGVLMTTVTGGANDDRHGCAQDTRHGCAQDATGGVGHLIEYLVLVWALYSWPPH